MRAVLFDLDGVLLDSYVAWYHVLNGFARDHGYPAISEDEHAACWAQGVEADVATWFTRHTPEEVEGYYNARFPDHLEHVEVFEGAREIFAALRAGGLATAITTNTYEPLAVRTLGGLEIAPDRIFGTGGGVAAKPAPDILVRALEAFGCAPADAVMVGDTRYDREAADAAGVPFIGMRFDGPRRVETLAELEALLLGQS